VWGDGAEPLLEWLGLDRELWIQRDSMLEEHIKELRGLVLIDLPDIDSVAMSHRDTCQQLIPLADMLVWVTDPVKYADPSLHARYLEPMGEHEGSMVMVLNQSDTLDAADLKAVKEDLTARLKRDGMSELQVLTTSAVKGHGVDELRNLLVGATRSRTTTAKRGIVHLREVARQLEEIVGAPTKGGAGDSWVGAAQSEAIESLRRSCGGPAAVEALADGREPDKLTPPHMDHIRMMLLTWLQRALEEVPAPWGPAIGHTLASSQNISFRLTEVLPSITPTPRPGLFARLLRRGRCHRARADRFDADLRTCLETLVTRTMTAPTIAVLEDWADARATLRRIAQG
jgi:hypothetical protein